MFSFFVMQDENDCFYMCVMIYRSWWLFKGMKSTHAKLYNNILLLYDSHIFIPTPVWRSWHHQYGRNNDFFFHY